MHLGHGTAMVVARLGHKLQWPGWDDTVLGPTTKLGPLKLTRGALV